MYSITESIYYSQLSSVAILLQPEPVSHRIIQANDGVFSPSVLFIRSPPVSHVSASNDQCSCSSQLFCVHCTAASSSVVQWLSCLLLGPKFAGWNRAEDDGFLMTIKIRSTIFFGGEVKPSSPCRKVSRRGKDPYSMKETLVGKIHGHFSPSFFWFATRCVGYFQRALVGESGMIRTQMGKWGALCNTTP
jgi:hypothetical protein